MGKHCRNTSRKNMKTSAKKDASILSWGFPSLDKATGGLAPGKISVFAAHAGIGKTAMALNLIDQLALEQSIPVGMICLDMNKNQLLVRLASIRGKIDLLQLYLGKGS